MEELKRENARLKKEAANEESKKKKKKGTIEKAREDQVIDRHLVNDAKKKLISTSCYDSRVMQDNINTSSQNVGQSKGQSNRGPTDAKWTKPGDFRPDPVGTSKNNYSHLQGPQWGKPKGNQGPSFTQILWQKSPQDCQTTQKSKLHPDVPP